MKRALSTPAPLGSVLFGRTLTSRFRLSPMCGSEGAWTSSSADVDGEEGFLRTRDLHASELLGAVTTYVCYKGSLDPDKQEEWQEARDWLFSDEEGAGGFLEACEELDLRPAHVRLLSGQLDPSFIESAKLKDKLQAKLKKVWLDG